MEVGGFGSDVGMCSDKVRMTHCGRAMVFRLGGQDSDGRDLSRSERGARTVRIVPGHSYALIYERTTTSVSINIQQDVHIRKRANTNKAQWNVREHG